MEKNNWSKSINKAVPYLSWESITRDIRTKWQSNRHSNITFELHVILQGSCEIEVDDTPITLRTGQAAIIQPGVFHAALSNTEPFLRFTLGFFVQDPSLLSSAFPEGQPYIIFDTSEDMQQLCFSILRENDYPNPCFGQEMISVLLSQLWILIFRAILPEKAFSQNSTQASFSDIRTIELFFSGDSKQKKCTRRELAELLHCSERQVNRVLLQLYGMNFRQKKQQTRMDRAKFFLRNTDKKISEICSLVGYSDETTFYKAFKENCQMTPQEFRRRYNKQ